MPISNAEILNQLGYIDANLQSAVEQQGGTTVLQIYRTNGQTDRAVIRRSPNGETFEIVEYPKTVSDDPNPRKPKTADQSIVDSPAAGAGARTVQTGTAGNPGHGNVWTAPGQGNIPRGTTTPPPATPPPASAPAPAATGPATPSGASGSTPAMYVGMDAYLNSIKRSGWEPIGRGQEMQITTDPDTGKSTSAASGNTILTIRSPDGKTTEFYTVKVTPNQDGTESFGTIKAAAGTLSNAQDAGNNRQVVSTSDGSIYLIDKGDPDKGVPPTVLTMRNGLTEKVPKLGPADKFIKIQDDQGRTIGIADPESGTHWSVTPDPNKGKPGQVKTTVTGDRKIVSIADENGDYQVTTVTGLTATPQEQAQINLQAAQATQAAAAAALANAQAGVVGDTAAAENELRRAQAALNAAQAEEFKLTAQAGRELTGAQTAAQSATAEAQKALLAKTKQEMEAPVEMTADTKAAFRTWRDPKTNQVHYDINPNFQPQTLADVQTVVNQVQQRLRDKKAELSQKISKDYSEEQALSDYNAWYDATIRPMETQLETWQAQAGQVERTKAAEAQRANLTTAGQLGQYAVQAAQEERKNTVGPGWGKAFGALMNSFQANTPLKEQGNIDWAAATTYQAPTLDSIYEQAVAKYLQHISPTAAGIAGRPGSTPTMVQQQRTQSAGPTQQATLFDPASGLIGAPGTTPGIGLGSPGMTIPEQLDRTRFQPVQPINININSGQPAPLARLPLT